MKKAVMALIVSGLAAGLAQANTPPQVTNVVATQRPHTGLIDVTFDLADADGDTLHVTLWYSLNGGASWDNECTTVSGDVGPGILPATGAHATWDAGTDVPDFQDQQFTLRVYADDGSGDVPAVFVAIPAGTFIMGSPTDEPGRGIEETQHQVTLTHGFYIQSTEVTNQQYRDLAQWAYDHGYVGVTNGNLVDNLDGAGEILHLLGSSYEITFNAGVFSCTNPSHPTKYVTWYGSAAYCDWLSMQQGLPRAYNHATWQCNGGSPYTAAGYRLPTEAEWEYACRAGSTTAFANGPITQIWCSPLDPNLDVMGWYCGNADGWTHPVAQKQPNAWGLSDMHGNVWEWCNDWWAYYGGAVTDPVGPGTGSGRVVRGGFWSGLTSSCRSAGRSGGGPDFSRDGIGFRPARSAN